MTRVVLISALLLFNCAAIDAATVTRHGISIEYDPAAFVETFCVEKAPKPRPRNHPPRIERDFTPAELTFVLRSPSDIGGAQLSFTPTSHRNTAYFNEAYPDLAPEIERLKEILQARPALPRLDENKRPIDPLSQHPVYLISKVQYFDFPWGSAIGFLHFDAQDEGNAAGYDPIFGWSRLGYYLHGLTTDERFYVNGSLDVVLPELERGENKRMNERPTLGDAYAAYLTRATRLMERSPDESFNPSLAVLHNLMTSLRIGPRQARPEKWHRFRNRRKIALAPLPVRESLEKPR